MKNRLIPPLFLCTAVNWYNILHSLSRAGWWPLISQEQTSKNLANLLANAQNRFLCLFGAGPIFLFLTGCVMWFTPRKMPNFHNFHHFSEHWNYHQTAHTVPGKSSKRKEKQSVLMGEKEKSAYCLYCRRRGSSTTPVCLIMVPLVLKSNIEF